MSSPISRGSIRFSVDAVLSEGRSWSNSIRASGSFVIPPHTPLSQANGLAQFEFVSENPLTQPLADVRQELAVANRNLADVTQDLGDARGKLAATQSELKTAEEALDAERAKEAANKAKQSRRDLILTGLEIGALVVSAIQTLRTEAMGEGFDGTSTAAHFSQPAGLIPVIAGIWLYNRDKESLLFFHVMVLTGAAELVWQFAQLGAVPNIKSGEGFVQGARDCDSVAKQLQRAEPDPAKWQGQGATEYRKLNETQEKLAGWLKQADGAMAQIVDNQAEHATRIRVAMEMTLVVLRASAAICTGVAVWAAGTPPGARPAAIQKLAKVVDRAAGTAVAACGVMAITGLILGNDCAKEAEKCAEVYRDVLARTQV